MQEEIAFYVNSPYSNFYKTVVKVDEIDFPSSEAAFMYCKAMLFGDAKIAAAITLAKTPKQAKLLGRKMANFDQSIWESHREGIMQKVLLAKFDQNKKLRELIVSHKSASFVEATANDAVWGTGISLKDFRAGKTWTGLNLLGKCIGRVRDLLVQQDELFLM